MMENFNKIKKIKIIIPFLLLALILIGGSCKKEPSNGTSPETTPPANEPVQMIVFTNEDWGFEIKHPENWEERLYTDTATLFSVAFINSENQDVGLIVIVFKPEPGEIFDEEAASAVKQLEDTGALLSQTVKTISEHSSRELVYYDNPSYPRVKTLHYLIDGGDLWYQLMFSANDDLYSEYLPEAQEIIDSFVITE